jgi:hypothetical protein
LIVSEKYCDILIPYPTHLCFIDKSPLTSILSPLGEEAIKFSSPPRGEGRVRG